MLILLGVIMAGESPLSDKPEETGVSKSLGIKYGQFGSGIFVVF